MLLVGAGLFLRSSQRARSVDPGFGLEPTALLTFLTPATRFTPDEARVYTRRLLDRFRVLPGVEVVGAISNLHLNPLSQSSSDFNVDGVEPPTDHGAFIADRVEVEQGFFEAAGIAIVRGRNFNNADRPDTRGPWSSSAMRWPGASERTATRSAGSSGGATTILLGSSSAWRATRR